MGASIGENRMFTRRHYEFVARHVGEMYPYEANGEFFRVVDEWATAFRGDNARFDSERFRRAAEKARFDAYGHRSNHSYIYGSESFSDDEGDEDEDVADTYSTFGR